MSADIRSKWSHSAWSESGQRSELVARGYRLLPQQVRVRENSYFRLRNQRSIFATPITLSVYLSRSEISRQRQLAAVELICQWRGQLRWPCSLAAFLTVRYRNSTLFVPVFYENGLTYRNENLFTVYKCLSLGISCVYRRRSRSDVCANTLSANRYRKFQLNPGGTRGEF